MAEDSLRRWLAGRTPETPPALVSHMVSVAAAAPPTPEGLAEGGIEAISSALHRPGRDREAAFFLLAGDALLTYACEALAERGGDLGEGLESMVNSIGARFP